MEFVQKPFKEIRVTVFGKEVGSLEKFPHGAEDLFLSFFVISAEIGGDEEVVVFYRMPLNEKTVKRLVPLCFVGKNNPFVVVKKSPEQDEPVRDITFQEVLERLFNTEHILAETSAGTLVMHPVGSYREFIPPGKKPDTRRDLFIEICIISTGAADKGKILDWTCLAMKPEVADHGEIYHSKRKNAILQGNAHPC